MIELKLDVDTLFEWQKHSQSSTEVPHFEKLLEFIDLRAQTSETSCVTHKKKPPNRVTSFAANTNSSGNNCFVCKTEKHPLYVCAKFRSLSHDEKVSVLKTNNLCSNCLTSGHFKRQCKSIHKCKVCQKLHHTLLHIYQQNPTPPAGSQTATPVSSTPVSSTPVSSNGGMKLKVEHFTHDMPCVCHRSRWVIRGSQSAAGQRFVCVIRIRAKSFFASLQSTRSSVWHWWCVTKGPYPVNFQFPNLSRQIQQKKDRDHSCSRSEGHL